jgi:hypothetical protein
LRGHLAILALLLPLPAAGQQALSPLQREAVDIIAASAMDAGIDAPMAITFGECFATNMTEAEAEAFTAADNVEAQQAITSSIAAHDDAVLCVASSIELE